MEIVLCVIVLLVKIKGCLVFELCLGFRNFGFQISVEA